MSIDPSHQNKTLSGLQIFFIVFLPFAFAHFLSFIFRSVNAVLAPNLIASFSLTPVQLGTLTSAYFLTFALSQLPVGIVLDRYGSRRVQCFLLVVATLGSFLFAIGNSYFALTLARGIIGLGLGACFMAAIKIISYYVPSKKLPSIHSYLIALGGLGAMVSTAPVQMVLHVANWRVVFYLLGALTAVNALIIYLFAPKNYNCTNSTVTISSLLRVYCEPTFRRTISLVLIPHTVFFGIQGLWLGRYLQDVGHYSSGSIANILFYSMAAIVVGTLSVGKITEWLNRFGIQTITVAGYGVILFVLIQILILINMQVSLAYLAILFMLFGTFCGLEYTIIAQSVPPEMTGRAATCLNLLILSGAFVVQAGFGFIVNLWSPNAQLHYPMIAYQVALGVFILLQLPGIVSWLLRGFYIDKSIGIKSV